MPELPEVEHVRKNLERWMRGGRIESVVTTDARIVRPMKVAVFRSRLGGRTVEGIARRGKWLRCLLDDGQRLFIHLGMTGWFEHATKADPGNPHGAAGDHLRFERVRFVVTRRSREHAVVYVDPRRWGRMVLARDDIASWTSLGPDPLADPIDVDVLLAKLARRRTSIKECLMDQRILAGIGNIQAIEALWKARVDPRSRAGAIGRADVVRIGRAVHWTIERTLADLAKGGTESPFRVYGRSGQPCPRCKTPLERIELGGRTTTFCPGCQRRLR